MRASPVIALYITVQAPAATSDEPAPKRTCADLRSAVTPSESEYASENVRVTPNPPFGKEEIASTSAPTVNVPGVCHPVVWP